MLKDNVLRDQRDWHQIAPIYQMITESALDIIGIIDRTGTLTYLSPATRTIYGIDAEEMVGTRAFEHAIPEDRDALWKALKTALRTKQPIRVEFRTRRGSELITLEARGNPLMNSNGQIAYIVFIIRDVTARKKTELRLSRNNTFLRRIVRAEPLNDVLRGLMQALADDVGLLCAVEFVDNRFQNVAFPTDVYQNANAVAIRSKPIVSANGTLLGTMTAYAPTGFMLADDALAELESCANLAGLAIERAHHEYEVQQLVYHDALTGLPNRRMVSERVIEAIQEHGEQPFALFVLDLDRFKAINDSFGHPFGDKLLQVVAVRLRNHLPFSTVLARVGGDEFTIFIPSVSDMDAVDAAATLVLDSFERPIFVDGHELRVTPSIGVAVYPEHGRDLDTLLRNADTAMYSAKRQGRFTYRLYEPEMSDGLHERLLMESHLQKALERNEFAVYYQPRFRTLDGRLTGVEALLRWTHPELGRVSPADFIPLAEDTGLIMPIGNYVLKAVCEQIRCWMDMGVEPLRVAVNVSGYQLRQAHFADHVRSVMEETGIDPRWLEFEITESAIIQQAEQTIDDIRILRELGVMVSIDDFGTGYSSLRRLAKLPVDTLKIDQSFIEEIPHNQDNVAIAQTIISLARNLNMRVVAEGVETVEQRVALSDLCCDEMQGYLFSHPVRADELIELLWERRLAPL